MALAVVSPANGVVSALSEREVQVYLPPDVDHSLYAPVTGRLVSVRGYQGHWHRRVFESDIERRGRAVLTIEPDALSCPIENAVSVRMWVEVGEGYITDRVRIDVHAGAYLQRGQRVGEVLLGSLSGVEFESASLPLDVRYQVQLGDPVRGGTDVLAVVGEQRGSTPTSGIGWPWPPIRPNAARLPPGPRDVVVLTAPHSDCPPEASSRQCDLAAWPADLAIEDALLSASPFEAVRLAQPRELRARCDLNRPTARWEPYRRGISDFLAANRGRIAFVLDVHSFPAGYSEFGPSGIEVALLDDTGAPWQPWTREIYQALRRAGAEVSLVHGVDNDIQDEARDRFHLPSLLIEFSEALPADPDRLQMLAEAVVHGLEAWFATAWSGV